MTERCLLCTEAFDPDDDPIALEIRACSGRYAGRSGYLCGPECIELFIQSLDEGAENGDDTCDVIAEAFELVQETIRKEEGSS